MRYRRLVGLALLAVAVAVAGLLGASWGARPPPVPPVPAAGVVPIEPGAPERLERLDLPLDGGTTGGADAAITADGRALLTVDIDGRLVVVVDLVARRVATVPTGAPPATSAVGDDREARPALAVSPDGRTAWVTDGRGRRVQVVDLLARAIVAEVAVPAVPTAVVAVGDRVVVGDAAGAVTTIDPVSRRPLATRGVATGPIADLAATPGRPGVVAVADPAGADGPGSVSLVDLGDPRAPTVSRSWPVSRPRAPGGTSTVVSPDGARAYVVTGPGVLVLDLRTGGEVASVPGPATDAVALSPDGRRLYLSRALELRTAAGPSPRRVLDAVAVADLTAAPGGRPLGSLTQEVSALDGSWLLSAPDGRLLYSATGGVSVVSLRGG